MIKQLFCSHTFIKTVSIQSERKGDNNYIYDYEHFRCERCGYSYVTKMLNRIERGFYRNK